MEAHEEMNRDRDLRIPWELRLQRRVDLEVAARLALPALVKVVEAAKRVEDPKVPLWGAIEGLRAALAELEKRERK